jgi:hypothetical protein
MKMNVYLTPSIENNSKEPKTIKPLEENIRINHHEYGKGNGFKYETRSTSNKRKKYITRLQQN